MVNLVEPDRTTSVIAVTVTYGHRAALVVQTVDQAIVAGVTSFVIVLNGTSASVRGDLERSFFNHKSVVIRYIQLLDNIGSAGGFRAGLAAALADEGASLFWLLDDDNLAESDALEKALHHLQELERAHGHGRVAISCFRSAFEQHCQVIEGRNAYDVYPKPGAVAAFDFRARLAKRLPNPFARITFGSRRQALARFELPFAPYGGFLCRRSTVEAIGLPAADWVVYWDDFEFTTRIHNSGTKIMLARDAVVVDADHNGNHIDPEEPSQVTVRLLRKSGAARLTVYYFARNSVHFGRLRCSSISDKLSFAINLALYTVGVFMLSMQHPKNRSALGPLMAGLRDGVAGRFGRPRPLL